jgi:sarcosine oxidase subunit beta
MTSATDLIADVVICGAGIAGVSAAYNLAVKYGVKDILLVDENAPLSLTSDQSTECYRNWWPGPDNAMIALMNHSIDMMEELAVKSGNIFHLNRRGFLYCTTNLDKIPEMKTAALEISNLGAGQLRIFTGSSEDPPYIPTAVHGFQGQPDGADLFLDYELIHKFFPYLSENIVASLHIRRAGWLSAQQLGMYMLEQARSLGVRLLRHRVTRMVVEKSHIAGVYLEDGSKIKTSTFVNAAGPFLKQVGQLLGVELPVYHELHQKVSFKDTLGILDRNAPLVVYTDPQTLDWTDEEQKILYEDPELTWLMNELPSGVHTRPEGGTDSQIILMLWEYHIAETRPTFPITIDPQYAEITLRGLIKMLPGMHAYLDKATRPHVDGGYYTKTKENRPLIGTLPVSGAYIIGALSGFGIMSSCAAGDLLAAHVTGVPLPAYAPAFSLERYQDPIYQSLLNNWGATGQL